jgi:hypothetical protein
MPKASQSRRRKPEQDQPASQEQPTAATKTGVLPRRRVQELSNRVRVTSLVIGDILCFLIFVSLGSDAHGKGVNFLYSLWLSIPFLAAWFIVAPFVGAYRSDVATRPAKMVLRTLLCWVASWPVAMFFRWLLVEHVTPVSLGSFLSFSAVVLITNFILLVIWRWPFTLNNSFRKRGV